mmetsp:Transcript_2396/g.10950  ORF Transcript_2396/g.10950 Transcript_2396/m.10950 type:complete len:220 (-) Transcript_2396:1411-2070(-)
MTHEVDRTPRARDDHVRRRRVGDRRERGTGQLDGPVVPPSPATRPPNPLATALPFRPLHVLPSLGGGVSLGSLFSLGLARRRRGFLLLLARQVIHAQPRDPVPGARRGAKVQKPEAVPARAPDGDGGPDPRSLAGVRQRVAAHPGHQHRLPRARLRDAPRRRRAVRVGNERPRPVVPAPPAGPRHVDDPGPTPAEVEPDPPLVVRVLLAPVHRAPETRS